jgi:hypothetical protein
MIGFTYPPVIYPIKQIAKNNVDANIKSGAEWRDADEIP